MKKFIFGFVLLMLAGCTTVTIPNYIQSKNPYKKTFYAEFDRVLEATSKSLEDFKWKIEGTSNPAVFERNKIAEDANIEQVVIFTETRQTPLFLGSRYAKMNIYVRAGSVPKTIVVEVRYMTVNSLPFKSFYKYKSDGAVNRIFRHIEELLN